MHKLEVLRWPMQVSLTLEGNRLGYLSLFYMQQIVTVIVLRVPCFHRCCLWSLVKICYEMGNEGIHSPLPLQTTGLTAGKCECFAGER